MAIGLSARSRVVMEGTEYDNENVTTLNHNSTESSVSDLTLKYETALRNILAVRNLLYDLFDKMTLKGMSTFAVKIIFQDVLESCNSLLILP